MEQWTGASAADSYAVCIVFDRWNKDADDEGIFF